MDKSFILALFALNAYLWCSIIEPVYGIPKIIKYGFSTAAIALLLFFSLRSKRRLSELPECPVIIWFCVYSIFHLLLSFRPELFYVQEVFASRFYFLPYVFPLLLLAARIDAILLAKVLAVSRFMLVPAIIATAFALSMSTGEHRWSLVSAYLSMFNIFFWLLLFSAHLFQKANVSMGVLFYYVLNLLVIGVYGRRGGFSIIAIGILFAVWHQAKSRVTSPMSKTLAIVVVCLLLVASLFYGHRLGELQVFQRGISIEGFEQSRSTVIEDYFDDFGGMRDWLVGRGINGTVKRTIRGGDVARGIENGYLTILLRGGLLYLAPMLFLMLRSAYLGYFRSRNDLSRALAIIVGLHFLNMMAFGLPDMSSSYVLVWVAISAGLNPDLRMMDNRMVIYIFNGGSRTLS